MPYADLRQFLARLEEAGELQRIDQEVDWNLELGAIVRRAYDLRAPAPFFQKVHGYPSGYRVMAGLLSASRGSKGYLPRMALALDMSPEASAQELMEEYLRRRKKLVKPLVVKDGPCKEVIHTGDDVNLLEFPAPFIHNGDGGRYVGTLHATVTKDPDSDWTNWGCYRLMISDEKTMVGLIEPTQHIGIMYYGRYEARSRPMEFAVAIGTEPVTTLAAISRIPPGISEAEVVGGLRGEPIELIKCETVDLMVPATAEIVIEGEIWPHERRMEGPFGEYTGYRSHHEPAPQPVYHIKAITHRQDPILTINVPGILPYDEAVPATLTLSADLLDDLRQRGLPVKCVFLPPQAVVAMAFVSTRTPYPNIAKTIAHAIWATHAGPAVWYVVVVDEDVDATNLDEVIHSLATRCRPDRGIHTVSDAPVTRLAPYLEPGERELGRGAYALFDCTWPKHWKPEEVPLKATFDVLWPKDIQERVLSKWHDYGYQDA